MTALSVPAQLLRGFAVDFLTAHSADAAKTIMAPGYRLSISGHLFDGRDHSYLPATVAQLEAFPGLCVTAHDVVLAPGAAAMRFTEHGAAAKDGTISTWGGITLFEIADGQLQHGWAEEDYFARKRQLKSREADAIRPPHAAPWDVAVAAADPGTEAIVRDWLSSPARIFDSIDEISAEGPRLASLIEPEAIAVSYLFSAGPRAAFHAVLTGRYAGGYPDVPSERVGETVTMPVAAIVDTDGRSITNVQLCGDRLTLNRTLLPSR